MARMFPAVSPTTATPDERLLFARLARELGASWQIIYRAGGAGRGLDFVLLHRDYGIALLGVAKQGEVEDPSRAVTAMRALLEEIGFARRYPGHLAIVARRIVPDAISDLAAFLAVRFAAAPVSAIADPTWPDWLVQRLAPEHVPAEHRSPARTGAQGARPAAPRGLRAPTTEDSWHSWAGSKPRGAVSGKRGEPGSAPAEVPVARVVAERPRVSRVAETRSPLWTGMVLSVFVVTVVLVGIAVLSHGNRSSDILARQSAVPSLPAPGAPAPAN